jgi:hypothetical protein
LDEIVDYGEQEYFQMIYTLTSVASDYKWQLDDMGVDYTKVNDFELFYSMLIKRYSQDKTSILFGDLDFTKFGIFTNTSNNEVCMMQEVIETHKHEKIYGKYDKYIKPLMKVFHIKPKYTESQENKQIIIDGYTYQLIIEFIRKMHGLKRNNQVPANESTKRILIEDAREEYRLSQNKEYHSYLLNIISAMINNEGFKYNHDNVWSMKIYAFLDSVRRISKIKNAELLLQSGYSGNGISFKDIDKKQLDWLGELD